MEKTLTYSTKRFRLLAGYFVLAVLGVLSLPNIANAQYTQPPHYMGCHWNNNGQYAAIEDIAIQDNSGNTVFTKSGDGCNDVNPGLGSGHYNLMTTTSSFTLNGGAQYTFEIEMSNPNNFGTSTRVGVWFDFNGDQDFADAGEFVSPSNWTVAVGNKARFNFTVPCGGKTSGPIRMRVRSNASFYNLTANNHSTTGTAMYYGETEDYTCSYALVPGLNADFFAPDTVFVNTIAGFVNANQSGYIGHEWTVDGSTYNGTNAEHIFTSTGTFDVKLKSTNCNGSDSLTKSVVVVAPTAPPVADFVSTRNVMEIFDVFELIDLSTNGPTNWDWYAYNGNGDTVSIAQGGDPYTHRNPLVLTNTNPAGIPKIFVDEGLWSVCLKSSNGVGPSTTVCKTDYIEVRRTNFSIGPETSLPANIITASSGTLYDKGGPNNNYPNNDANLEALIAPCGAQSVTLNFNMFKVLANANLKVYDGINALGTPLHPGNGFTAGNAPSGPLTANSGAIYLLWNSGAGGSDSGFAATWTSVAGTGGALVADFELPADTLYNAVEESFINTSENAGGNTSFEWIVNNVLVATTRDLVDQLYLTNGNYTITLRAIGCDGTTSTRTKSFFVANPNTPTELDFTADNRRPAVGDQVTLTATSDKANRWEWSFFPPTGVTATGATSNMLRERTFQFGQPGVYAVQLKGYNYNASPDSSVSENTITKTQYIVVVEHCVPVVSVTTSSDVGISRVMIEDAATGDSQENESETGVAYEDFTDIGTVELNFGGEYNFEVERSTNINPMNRKIWIDWNVDGDFDDANELVATEGTGRTLSWSGSFTVPDASEAFEATTRMRVGVSYGTDLNEPCGANSNAAANRIGEFEDYSVRVVNDGDNPVITLNGADTIYIEQATTPNYVSPGATAMDASQGDITSNINVTSDVDQTLAGVYYEVYTAADASGNEAMPVTRVVYVVLDQTPPVLTLNGAADITLEVGSSYSELGATATDAKEGNLDGAIIITGNVDVNTLGTYTVTYYVQDNQGNSSTATRTINVVDTEAPVIENVNADKSDPSAWVVEVQLRSIFVDVTATTDNYNSFGNNLTLQINPVSPQGGAAVDTRFQGTTSVTYTATDESGNQTVQVINYVVRDFVPPVIDLRTLDVIEHEVNNPYTPVAPTASDNLYDNTQISLTQSSNVNPYVLGTYQDTYTATDAAGNVSTKVRTVHVVDNEAPTLSGKQGGVIRIGVGSAFNAQNFVLFADNYDSPADLIANHTLDYNDINVWEPGLYSAVFTTQDNSGNTSNSFTLYVEVSHDYFRLTNGIEDLALENILNVAPNPTSGIFNINVNLPENEDIALNVFNAYGKKVMEVANGNIQKGAYTVDISNNANGIYYVQMNVQGTILTKKVVLNK